MSSHVGKIDTTAELDFLDALAGTAEAGTTAATEAPDSKPSTSAKALSAKVDNTSELALLDSLVGVKHEDDKPADVPVTEPKEEAKDGHGDGDSKPQEDTKDAAAQEEEEETYERDAEELLTSFKGPEETKEEQMTAEEAMKIFESEMRNVDRDNEVQRIIWAFKLNPFEKMSLRFTATEADVKRQYRKISLLIHPDKCKHPQAPEAFEILGAAQKELLEEETRERLMRVLEYARDAVREERRKATKHDSGVRLAASLHAEGRAGVEAEWEETEDFHEKWKIKSRDVLARAEFRRIKLTKRMREEEERVQAEEKEEASKRKKKRQETKDFLSTRSNRIDSWRNWTKSGSKTAGTKAPKIKTWDNDKSYVQRATTEQFVGNYKKKPPK